MLLGQTIPQNYTYTSKTTEFGRGPRFVNKAGADAVQGVTPGPGTYDAKTDFEKKMQQVFVGSHVDDIGEQTQGDESHEAMPQVETVSKWDQKGYRYSLSLVQFDTFDLVLATQFGRRKRTQTTLASASTSFPKV